MVAWPEFGFSVGNQRKKPMSETGLRAINDMRSEEAQGAFHECCGSIRWASSMTRERPFLEAAELHHSADRLWGRVRDEDRLEAFAAHPKIGDSGSVRSGLTGTEWASEEQSAASTASEDVLRALAEGNSAYEERFGYIFIICASGKNADEMVQELNRRIANDPIVELGEASEQQRQIMHLRLAKMLTKLGANDRRFRP